MTSLLDPIADADRWSALVDTYAIANRRRRDKIAAYRQVVDSRDWERIAHTVLDRSYRFRPAAEAFVNKAGGKRKRVFQLAPADELLCKVANQVLQPAAVVATSPACHSFLPGSGARTAFRALLRDPDLDAKACLRLDVSDYFNTIDVRRLLDELPAPFDEDKTVVSFLDALLADPSRGVMAGTPLAPMLANLYLRSLDESFVDAGVTYGRYSDDIIVLDAEAAIDAHDDVIRSHLTAYGLTPNEQKSGRSRAGEPWEYLGFQYSPTAIDVSANTRRKLRGKMTRLARKLDRHRTRRELATDDVVGWFVRRYQQTVFGLDRDADRFCWATWFFPIITTDASLAELDSFVQERIRFAATGTHTNRAHKAVPYELLRQKGYVPLRSAWWSLFHQRRAQQREQPVPSMHQRAQ